jgi:hypothetical protein
MMSTVDIMTLPQFKDQVRDKPPRGVDRSSPSAVAPREEPLPEFKDQVYNRHSHRQAHDPPQSRIAIKPEVVSEHDGHNILPDFKDQVLENNLGAVGALQVHHTDKENDPSTQSSGKTNDSHSPRLKFQPVIQEPRQRDAHDTLSTAASSTDNAAVVFGPSMVQSYRPTAASGRVAEAQGILIGEIFEESPTHIQESEEIPPDTQTNIPKHRARNIAFIVLALLLVAGATVGGVCGSGKCGSGTTKTDTNPITDDPGLSCEGGDFPKSFETTEELYKAVDEYYALVDGSSNGQEGTSQPCNVTFRYGPIGQWDVSRLTDFQLVFHRNRDLYKNQDLLKPMLQTSDLYEDIKAWNVSAATNMEAMFAGVKNFIPFFLKTWDTSRVTSMKAMVRNVHYYSSKKVSQMFLNCLLIPQFHSSSKQDEDFSSWNTAAVTDFSFIFVGNTAFTGRGLEKWNTSSALTLSGMFSGASSLSNVDFTSWNVNKVVDASFLFNGCESFLGDVSTWKLESATSLRGTFQDCSSFNGHLAGWMVSTVKDFSSMFQGASSFDGDLSSWDTRSAELMNSTFQNAAVFTGIGLSSWNVSSVRYMNSMFEKAITLSSVDLSAWQLGNVESMASMFKDASMFTGTGLGPWDVSSVMDMSSMFEGATSLGVVDLSGWRTDNLGKSTSMFKGASSFTSDLPWKMSLVTDMFEMCE